MIKRLECFSVITERKKPILKALQNRELDCGEISIRTGMSRSSVLWHLKSLQDCGLIKAMEGKKINTDPRAKNKFRGILRYSLTLEGRQGLEYFEGVI